MATLSDLKMNDSMVARLPQGSSISMLFLQFLISKYRRHVKWRTPILGPEHSRFGSTLFQAVARPSVGRRWVECRPSAVFHNYCVPI
jgi:hypothetical protein